MPHPSTPPPPPMHMTHQQQQRGGKKISHHLCLQKKNPAPHFTDIVSILALQHSLSSSYVQHYSQSLKKYKVLQILACFFVHHFGVCGQGLYIYIYVVDVLQNYNMWPSIYREIMIFHRALGPGFTISVLFLAKGE